MSLRYLVVGYGNVGQRRARILGDRCVAAVDPAGIPGAERRVEDVPANAYDAVVLATPNAGKLDDVRRFLGAGKSVLVEKPLLFASREEAEALRRAARGGAIWYTAYNHRFEPLVARAAQLIRDGAIGKLDRARLVYGNGTVRNWIGTWRESGAGVLEDLGCHLLDLAGWVLGLERSRWRLLDLRPVESATFDYGLIASSDRRVVLEIGTVFWKNTFRIDAWGDTGSIHVDGLGKWGGATLVHHARVLPSGVPVETREATGSGDPTWTADFAEFERRVASRDDTLENDWRISEAIASLMAELPAVTAGSDS